MKSLTKAEEQVMMALWSLGKGFLKEVMDHMPEPKPHSNTVATVLKVLVEKEFVQTETHGRNNLYLPCISKELYGKKTANLLVKGYFDNSPSQLLSHFIKDEQISMEELEQLLQQVRSSKKVGK
jgi:predicted transcriptional regulator